MDGDKCIICSTSMQSELIEVLDHIISELSYLAHIQVSKSDMICTRCIQYLESACRFKRQCIFAHHKKSVCDIKSTQDKNATLDQGKKLQQSDCILEKKRDDKNAFSCRIDNSNVIDKKNKKKKNKERDGNIKSSSNSSIVEQDDFISDEVIEDLSKKCHSSVNLHKHKGVTSANTKREYHKTNKKRHLNKLSRVIINDLVEDKNEEVIVKKMDDMSGICFTCGRFFTDIDAHMKRCPTIMKKTKRVLCEKCGKTLTDIKKHNCKGYNVREEQKYPCEICSKILNSYNSLWSHKRYSHDVKKINYDCRLCPKSYTNASSRREHVLMKHSNGPLPHVCDVCSKGFPTTTKLKRHSSTHSNDFSFECFICTQKFPQKEDLATHLKMQHDNFFVENRTFLPKPIVKTIINI